MKPGILAIDIGGTGLKATVIDDHGHMRAERVRIPTPHPCPPALLLEKLREMAAPLPDYDRIAIGFPGVVRNGHVYTAAHLDSPEWIGYDLAGAVSRTLGGKPVKLLNDADLQGLALISGHGLELVMTLGTGVGTGLYRDGELMPHMEIAHHPIHKNRTYDEYLGEAERKKIGRKRWNRRLARALELMNILLRPDRIYLGGGNSARVDLKLDKHVLIGSNDAGLEGGAFVWKSDQRGKTGTTAAVAGKVVLKKAASKGAVTKKTAPTKRASKTQAVKKQAPRKSTARKSTARKTSAR
ncbi:ROK family protein [Achromobacter aloeverae]|uniref:ROK family protein n=1 Tax=Achromobacter aloeverae TaxID=1750518 RepID=UPI0019585816|nr:ROK family protein [Achromobacter aloeverae]